MASKQSKLAKVAKYLKSKVRSITTWEYFIFLWGFVQNNCGAAIENESFSRNNI